MLSLEKEMIKQNYDKEYINIVKVYAHRLVENNIPIIFNFEHLCFLTNYSTEKLRYFIHNNQSLYKEIEIEKKSGNTRLISIPNNELKVIQRWILDEILSKIPLSPHAKGFRKGQSIINNAQLHTNKECVMNLDIQDFFGSVTQKQVYKIFRYVGYTKQVSSILSLLCTKDGVLPQGAPTSPYIANLVCKKLDKRISNLFINKPINYTRYADDITVSGEATIKDYLPILIKIITDEGFEINTNKTRIQYSYNRQIVTGLVVNQKINVPKKMIKQLRLEIYYCKKYGVAGHIDKRHIEYSNYKHHLFGKAYYIKMVNPKLGQKFLNELNEINWDY